MSKSLLNLLLVVATFAVYYLLIGPLYTGTGGMWQPAESVQSLKQMNTQYDETLAQADDLYNQAETLKSQYMRVSNDQKAVMQVMVPDSIDKVRLMSEVNSIIEQSGLQPSELAYLDNTSNNNTRNTAGISFSVKTTYPAFKKMMDNFEKSMRLYSIQNVMFTASDKDGEPTTYQVKLETYYLK